MDEKKLLKSLSDLTAKLKDIADSLGVSTGTKGKKGVAKGSLSKDEERKQKNIAKIDAEEYKKTLGLNFKDKDNIDKIANRFRVVFNNSSSLRMLSLVKDSLKNLEKSLGKALTSFTSLSNLDTISDSIKNLGWEDFKTEILWNIREEENHRNFLVDSLDNINNSLTRLVENTDRKKTEKKEEKFDFVSKLKNIAGLALIGGGIYLIVQALVNAGDIDLVKTLKVLGVVSAFMLLFLYVADKASKIKTAAIGFAILSATVLFLIIPMIDELAKMSWETYIDGLFKMAIVLSSCIGLLKLMSYVKSSDVVKSTSGMVLLTLTLGFVILPLLEKISKYDYVMILEGLANTAIVVAGLGLIVKLIGKVFEKGITQTVTGMLAIVGLSFIMGYLAENLNKFASFDWANIYKNLGLALLAIGVFGAAITGIGFLVMNPVVAPLLAVGSAVVLGLSFLMGTIAEAAMKFSDINGENLIKIGTGLAALGIGLTAFLVGMTTGVAAGAISKISGFFGLDPASQIKKFETIDADKIFTLGHGLKEMGEGLKMLSSGINLKEITSQIVEMTVPIMNFASSIDKFNSSFANLDKTISGSEITSIYKLKIENENNIQNSILELNKQELEVQQAQLEELRNNGEFLRVIAENIGYSGGAGGGNIIQQNRNSESGFSPNFGTKTKYLNHLKLTSMSINA